MALGVSVSMLRVTYSYRAWVRLSLSTDNARLWWKLRGQRGNKIVLQQGYVDGEINNEYGTIRTTKDSIIYKRVAIIREMNFRPLPIFPEPYFERIWEILVEMPTYRRRSIVPCLTGRVRSPTRYSCGGRIEAPVAIVSLVSVRASGTRQFHVPPCIIATHNQICLTVIPKRIGHSVVWHGIISRVHSNIESLITVSGNNQAHSSSTKSSARHIFSKRFAHVSGACRHAH